MAETVTKEGVATIPSRKEIPEPLTWRLETIYASDAGWEEDFRKVEELIPEVESFEGRLGHSGSILLEAFQKRDAAGEIMGRLYVYANMRMHENTGNSLYQGLAQRAEMLSNKLDTAGSYITPELLAIDRATVEGFISGSDGLALYQHEFDDIFRQQPHVCSREVEEVLARAGELTSSPGNVFEVFENADLRLPVLRDENGERVQLSHGNYISRFMLSQDRAVRKRAFKALHNTYSTFRNTLAANYSANVKSGIFYARSRKFDSALEGELFSINVPVSVYENLIETVEKNLAKLHRYLKIRKQILGVPSLHIYDFYVPLVKEVDYKVPFEKAKERVAESLAPLGADYVRILQKGFDSRWIDAMENQGKRSGAYSWGSYGTNPFVLLNYTDSIDDLFTLAHEMGHAMHSYYTRSSQPFAYGSYTIFVAEVASTLNEMLLTHFLLKEATDPEVRKYIINHALESFRGTLFRQTMFAEFERNTHQMAESGTALTADALCDMYSALNKKYYGKVAKVDKEVAIEWARIPHFYSSFYVYQYATGISAAAFLAKGILEEGSPAVDRYIRFLSSGSSDYSINLLRDAGVDLSSPDPVQRALDTFDEYLDEFEILI